MCDHPPETRLESRPSTYRLTRLLAVPESTNSPANWEWIVVATLGLLAVATTGYAAREWWFRADAWDFMTGRSLTDLESLIRPHAGHWQTPTVLIYLAVKTVAGMDFWPAYFIPRLVGYALLSIWSWYALRQRGTSPLAALASLAVLLWLAVSDWHDLSTIGNPIVLSSVLGVAMLSTTRPRNQARYRLVLASVLMLALMSGGTGIALLAGAAATAVISRERWSLWWPALAGAGVTYAIWYVNFRAATPSAHLSPRGVLKVPLLAFAMISNASAELLRIGRGPTAEMLRVEILGPMAATAAIGFVIWLIARRRFNSFDFVLIFTLGAYLAMVIILRVGAGTALPTATRYAQNIIFLLIPVVLPRLAPSTAPLRSLFVAVIVASLTLGNASTLSTRINFWERRAQASRLVVESAASLMNDGEPWLPNSSIDRPRAGMLTSTRLNELTLSGWDPPLAVDPEVVTKSRANLRFDLRPGTAVSGESPEVGNMEIVNGCVRTADGSGLSIEVDGQGAVHVSTDGPILEASWIDGYGVGATHFNLRNRFKSGGSLRVADPEGVANLLLDAQDDSFLEVCGVGTGG